MPRDSKEPDPGDLSRLQPWLDRILAMTRAVRRRDLDMQLGRRIDPDPMPPLTASDLLTIRRLGRDQAVNRLYFQAADHFLRIRVEPVQAMLTSWMAGARAQVNGEDIPFNRVITWCQDTADHRARDLLTREVRTLCRFLAPLSHATWQALLALVREKLGFANYISFCEQKRDVRLDRAGALAVAFLESEREGQLETIDALLRAVTGVPLQQASRFDAIYLLGLRYLDHCFPPDLATATILEFFSRAGFSRIRSPALTIHHVGRPGHQSYCMPLAIPGEIHIVLGPLQGWLDLEALCHELGHALAFLYTDSNLPPLQREIFPSSGLSEAFAFLLQKTVMSVDFLEEVLGLASDHAATVAMVHQVKWMTLARRYAAKLCIELKNFRQQRLRNGEAFYAQTMRRETGFRYDPETYLFDLMPDFYTLDYFQGFLAAAILDDHLCRKAGNRWYQHPDTVSLLKSWWRQGNRPDLETFLADSLGQDLTPEPFLTACPHQPPGPASCRRTGNP
ncbi:hypothetical protein ACLG6S_10840 [Thermodesulfobacteriota bacterium B35]